MGVKQSILILGGGVFGLSSAVELARRGYRISLMDAGPIPHPKAASTDISKAVRMDYGADELYMSLMEEAFIVWDQWNREWNEPLYHQDGFLVLTRGNIEAGSFEANSLEMLHKHGHQVQKVNPAILKSKFPAWNAEKYLEGYFNPRAGWGESSKVVEHLLQVAKAAGVSIRHNLSASRICENDHKIAGIVASDGQFYGADYVILATGTWSPLLAQNLRPVITHLAQPIFYFRPKDPDLYKAERFPVWAADLSRTGWYGFPITKDGIVKVSNHGPGRQVHPDDERETTPQERDRCRRFLAESLPGLAEAPLVSSRTCLYCDSWDGHFYIDHDRDRPGLVYATGGSGHAFKFTPVLGRLVADVLEHKPNRFSARFAWRSVGVSVKEQARFQGKWD